MTESRLLVEKAEGICTFTMNRPTLMNALNVEFVEELQEAFAALQSSTDIRVVVLQGAGGNFSSGADMSFLNVEHGAPASLQGMRLVGRLIQTIREIPQPVITKVRGFAVGGGANLALSGDFVVASHEARFCQVFINIGAITDMGGTYFLPRLVGLAKARELAMLGEFIDGKTAASIGLIYRSFPDEELDREVDSLARKLSQKSPVAMTLIKEGLEASLSMSLSEVLEWEASHQAIMLQTKEHKEAVARYLKSRGKI